MFSCRTCCSADTDQKEFEVFNQNAKLKAATFGNRPGLQFKQEPRLPDWSTHQDHDIHFKSASQSMHKTGAPGKFEAVTFDQQPQASTKKDPRDANDSLSSKHINGIKEEDFNGIVFNRFDPTSRGL